MITKIRHTGLVVADLEKSLRFWRDVLGFSITRRMDESGPHIDALLGLESVHVTTVKLAAPDGSLIELLHFHSHPDRDSWEGTPHSTGLTHVALTVSDLDATCERLSKVGVKFNSAPQASPDGLARVSFATAPEGVLLELVEEIADPAQAGEADQGA